MFISSENFMLSWVERDISLWPQGQASESMLSRKYHGDKFLESCGKTVGSGREREIALRKERDTIREIKSPNNPYPHLLQPQ